MIVMMSTVLAVTISKDDTLTGLTPNLPMVSDMLTRIVSELFFVFFCFQDARRQQMTFDHSDSRR